MSSSLKITPEITAKHKELLFQKIGWMVYKLDAKASEVF